VREAPRIHARLAAPQPVRALEEPASVEPAIAVDAGETPETGVEKTGRGDTGGVAVTIHTSLNHDTVQPLQCSTATQTPGAQGGAGATSPRSRTPRRLKALMPVQSGATGASTIRLAGRRADNRLAPTTVTSTWPRSRSRMRTAAKGRMTSTQAGVGIEQTVRCESVRGLHHQNRSSRRIDERADGLRGMTERSVENDHASRLEFAVTTHGAL
jgi:hypothetical protein